MHSTYFYTRPQRGLCPPGTDHGKAHSGTGKLDHIPNIAADNPNCSDRSYSRTFCPLHCIFHYKAHLSIDIYHCSPNAVLSSHAEDKCQKHRELFPHCKMSEHSNVHSGNYYKIQKNMHFEHKIIKNLKKMSI